MAVPGLYRGIAGAKDESGLQAGLPGGIELGDSAVVGIVGERAPALALVRALVCPAADVGCMRLIEARAANNAAAKRSEVELSRRYAGFSDGPVRYAIIVIPPRVP